MPITSKFPPPINLVHSLLLRELQHRIHSFGLPPIVDAVVYAVLRKYFRALQSQTGGTAHEGAREHPRIPTPQISQHPSAFYIIPCYVQHMSELDSFLLAV